MKNTFLLESLREKKKLAALAFDSSQAVNSFLINGERAWLDKATRVGLVNSVGVAKKSGASEMEVWLNNKSFKIDCDTLEDVLTVLEIYAMSCYNVTAKHIALISEEQDYNKLYNYNYTVGYPKRLSFNF